MKPHDEHIDTSESAGPPRAVRRRYMGPFLLIALAAALLTVGIVPRLHASSALTQQVAVQHALSVAVIRPVSAPALQELLLPGSVMPFADASIYARTSGYLEHWYTDIGTKVTTGQTLAVIQTPELDAQLAQARADEATAQANFSYARVTSQRWQQMLDDTIRLAAGRRHPGERHAGQAGDAAIGAGQRQAPH